MTQSSAAVLDRDLDTAPIMINQERRLAFEEMLSADGRAFAPFHATVALDIRGLLNVVAFEEALQVVVRTHGALRAAFSPAPGTSRATRLERAHQLLETGVYHPGQYCQRIEPQARVPLDVRSEVTPDAVDAIVREESARPFDYGTPPLMRTVLLRLTDTHRIFVAVVHHLVADMVSLNIFTRDLESAYRTCADGTGAPISTDNAAYARTMRRLRNQLEGPMATRNARYWTARWADFGNTHFQRGDFPFALPVVGHADFGAGCEVLELAPEILHSVRRCARALRVTPYVICLAACAQLLHSSTKKDRLAIWANFSVRSARECQHVFGWLVHSHVLGIDVGAHPPGLPLLQHVQSVVLDAIDHCGMPLAELWRRLGGCPATGLKFFFDFLDIPEESPESNREVQMHRLRSHRPGRHAGDFELLAVARRDGLRLVASCENSLFASAAVRQMLQRYALILRDLTARATPTFPGS